MSVARTLRIGEISGGHVAAAERASVPLASSIASTVQSFVDALSAEGRAAEPPAPRAADEVVDAALSALGAMPASTGERATAVSLDGPSALAALFLSPLPRVDVGPRARAEVPSEDGRDSLADLIAAGMPEEDAANAPDEAASDATASSEPVTRLPLGSFTPPKVARPSLFSDAGETDAPPPMARAVWPGLTLPRGVARGGKRTAAEPAVEARIDARVDARTVAMFPAAANASPSTVTTPRGSFGGDGTRRGTAARPALGPEAASVTLRGEPSPVLREPPSVTLRGEPSPVLREPPSEVRLAPAPKVLGPAHPALDPTLVSVEAPVTPAPSGGVRVQRAIALPAEDDAGPIPLVRPRSVEAAFPLTKKRAFHPAPGSAERPEAHGPAVLEGAIAPAEHALADARSFLRVESVGPSLPAPAAVPPGAEERPEERWAGRANYLAPAAPSATGASRIELVHPSLGALTLELTTERAHALDVDIGAASSSAAIALRGTEEDLRRELREHGGELGRFRVRTRPIEEDASAKGTWQPRQAHERRRI